MRSVTSCDEGGKTTPSTAHPYTVDLVTSVGLSGLNSCGSMARESGAQDLLRLNPSRPSGWGDVPDDVIQVISSVSDIISLARAARCSVQLSAALGRDTRLPFGLPCLLHTDPSTWPDDWEHAGTTAALTGLDTPSVPAYVPSINPQNLWAGSNGDWIVTAYSQLTRMQLMNLYTGQTI